MSKNNKTTSDQEQQDKDFEMYRNIVMLLLLPLFLYLLYPFIFGGKKDADTVVEERIERVEEEVEESIRTKKLEDLSVLPEKSEKSLTPGNVVTKLGTSAAVVALTLNKGDEIEYLKQPQNDGWKGIVKGKNKGVYLVEITEVLIDNAKREHLAPNPCTDNQLIGADFVGKTIRIPGSCVHAE